jgi:hypothetical protein
MELTKFYKYSMYLFFMAILFLPINSQMWKPLGFVGLISGALWVKNIFIV